MKIIYISLIHSQITGTMLHLYKVHLMSRLGKFKSEANASQHVAQVKRVIASSLCNGSLDGLLNSRKPQPCELLIKRRRRLMGLWQVIATV